MAAAVILVIFMYFCSIKRNIIHIFSFKFMWIPKMIISDDDDNIDSDHFALITLADRHCLRGSNFVSHVTLFSVPLNFFQEEQ